MAETQLKYQDSFRYLGVEIQKSLSWQKHITERTNKCKFLLCKCRNIIRLRWGLDPQKMDWIYKAVIRPKLTYGAVIWANTIGKAQVDKMNKLQRLAMLSITQPLRSTSTAGMEAILGWKPLHLHAQEVGMCTYIRNEKIQKTVWDGMGMRSDISGHLGRWKAQEQEIKKQNYPIQNRICEKVWALERIPEVTTKEKWDSPLILYTDASKKGDHVGYAWLATIGDYEYANKSIPARDITVFHAEILAIKEALQWVLEAQEWDRNMLLFSDSRSAVQTLKGHIAKDEIIKETKTLFEQIKSKIDFDIRWIKGHDNACGNEAADALARKGAKDAELLQFCCPFIPPTFNELKKKISNHFTQKWQTQWNALKSCRISKLFYPIVAERKEVVQLSIRELQTLTHIATGHGLFKNHLRHWNKINEHLCSLCGEDDEDSWHLWEWCPRLETKRIEIQKEINGGLAFEKGVLRFAKQKEFMELLAENETLLTPNI